MTFFSFSFSLLLTLILPLSSATCFLPNGTSTSSAGAQPCSLDPTNPLSSVCCNTKWENPPGSDVKYGSTKDECLPNGLCQNRGFSSIAGEEQANWTHWYRDYCTDAEGRGCVGVCDTGLNANDVVRMTPCDGTATSEKWCCGDTMDCCQGVKNPRAVFVPRILSNSSGTNGSEVRPIPTPSNSVSLLPTAESKVGKTKVQSWTIGTGVGVGLGFPVMFLLGMALTKFRNKRKVVLPAELHTGDAKELHGQDGRNEKEKAMQLEELETPRGELYEERTKLELAGSVV